VRESRSLGSVRGTASNGRSYREHNRRTAEARSRGGDLAPIAAAFLDPEDYLLAAPVKEYSKC
jgi:hypothetical protein